MKKIIFLLVFISVFYLAFHFLSKSFNLLSISLEDGSSLKPLACDLNVRDCVYYFNGKRTKISLNPKPIKSLENIKISLKNLDCDGKIRLNIYGTNMYMGNIMYELSKIDNNDYEGDIVLNSSLLDTTRFRIEVFNGEKYTGFYFDFDVKSDI